MEQFLLAGPRDSQVKRAGKYQAPTWLNQEKYYAGSGKNRRDFALYNFEIQAPAPHSNMGWPGPAGTGSALRNSRLGYQEKTGSTALTPR
jgi:hypothetical protein